MMKKPQHAALALDLRTEAPPPPAPWLGILFPPREQRPGSPPIFGVGRLRRLDGTRCLLIHVAALDATTLEVRHRLSEPAGPFVVVGTLRHGAGWLDLNADDDMDPYEAWVEIRPRRHHERWKIVRADRKRQ
jgi:hypothetical protein